MTRIVLCSSHPMMIAGFRSMLHDAPEGFITTICSDPQHLADQIRAESGRLVMADMTSGISLEILDNLRVTSPGVAVILWVDSVSTEFISQALSLGVRGILPKNASVESHLECIRQVCAGELWIENALSKMLLGARHVHLTPRERQLTGLLALGLKNKEIGYRLGISEGTIKVYLSRLYAKIGVNDRLDLALLTLKNLGSDQNRGSENLAAMSSRGSFFVPPVISLGQMPVHVQ